MIGVIEPTLQMWLTLAIVVAAVALYAWDRIAMELVSLGTVAALLLLFYFMPVEGPGREALGTRALLAGYADPALIAVLALLVVAQGIVQTGALEAPVRVLMRLGGGQPAILMASMLVLVTLISAFLNDTPVVVIFLPIMAALSEKLSRSPSRVMIPLSYAAMLGGMTTLIGSSTNLLVAGTLERLEGIEMSFFQITPVGAVLALVGLAYVLLVLPRLLPDRSSVAEGFSVSGGKQFIASIDITSGSPLEGKGAVAGMFPDLPDMTVRLIRRGGETLLPPFEDVVLEPGDSVIVATTRKALTAAISARPDILEGVLEDPTSSDDNAKELKKGGDRILAEAVVAPASRMVGRTLSQTGFQQASGCAVLGIQRRSRMIRSAVSEIRLEAGDVLLLLGRRHNVRSLRQSHDVLLLEWSAMDLPEPRQANMAFAIFLSVVTLSAFDILPIVIAAFLGAGAMITTGCLNIRQATRAIDRRIFLLIGAALALGAAMEHTGAAAYLAHLVTTALAGSSPAIILSAFFLLVAVVTNILSNNATAVLFTPIAANLANQMGLDPAIFATAVIFASNCAFATPMGYQTNVLVMAPGHYRFSDYMRAGLPLAILIWLTFSLYGAWYYGL